MAGGTCNGRTAGALDIQRCAFPLDAAAKIVCLADAELNWLLVELEFSRSRFFRANLGRAHRVGPIGSRSDVFAAEVCRSESREWDDPWLFSLETGVSHHLFHHGWRFFQVKRESGFPIGNQVFG